MDRKQFQTIKIFIAMVLAGVIGQAVVINNYLLAVVSVVIAIILIVILRVQVKEIITDERDYENAGLAARYSLYIFSILGSTAAFIFISLRQVDPVYESIGTVLAYFICSILILYSVIFGYLQKNFLLRSRNILFVFLVTGAILFLTVAGAKFLNSKDEWVCNDGRWAKHGNPNSPMPQESCEKSKVYTSGQTIPWEEAVLLIKNCEVKFLMQTHALEITLTLKNNVELKTREPVIDEVFKVYDTVRKKCGQIPVATE